MFKIPVEGFSLADYVMKIMMDGNLEPKETISFPDDKERKDSLLEGYAYYCLGCGCLYKMNPGSEVKLDSDPGCVNCGGDRFGSLRKDIVVFPRDEMIILKQHNFEHCRCYVGKLKTGKAQSECWASYNFEEFQFGRFAICPKSGLLLICLNSTQEELDNAGYLRYH